MCPPASSTGVTQPEVLRVRLLGGFKASVGPRAVEGDAWRLKKAAGLVKLLALAPGHRLHREQAMDALWPDLGKKAASNNLRQALHAARKALDPTAGSRYLASQEESLALCPSGDVWVDVDAFEEAATTARRSHDPASYRAAIDLYAGELLPDDRFEEWAEERRGELRRLYLALLVEVAGLYEIRGEHEPTIEALQKAVAEEPTLEEAHAGLMRLYAHLGQEREVLSQYERLRGILSRELGTEPSTATRRLREQVADGRLTPMQLVGTPQGKPLDPTTHNLPSLRDSFVGRERERLEIKRALAMTRILTLTGTGGSGKTRVAVELARDLVGAYPDGVWLVELAPLSERELVPKAIAMALGVAERPGELLADTLAEVLRSREMLLIVDNCEHLVETAARLVNILLDSCPHLRVLTTSREALGVKGEVRWVVPPLSVPDSRCEATVKDLEGSESARLFLARARSRDPSFAFTSENAQAVARICRTLEGIPLAIELAAARVKTLSVGQLAERLVDSLNLLTSGDRTQTPRQQTLRSTLDWSHDLLSESERKVFRRLSVYAGGWTLDASEAVVSGEGIEEGEVLDLLSELVEKSLVVAELTAGSGVRYRLLEPVRQYALEKLEESREADTVRHRHARYCLTLARELEPKHRGPEEATWLERLEVEHANMRAALSWSLGGGNRELGVRLAAALWLFWDMRGHLSEGFKWLEEALSDDGGEAEPTARASAVYGLGVILASQGDFEWGVEYYKRALALYEELGDQGRIAEVLASYGWLTIYSNVTHAEALFERSLVTARDSGNQRVVPAVINGLAYIAFEGGNFERARRLREEALALSRDLGNVISAAHILFNMGYTELALGYREQATSLIAEALALGQELRNKELVAGCLLSSGIALMLQGDPERAKAMFARSLILDAEMGSKSGIAEDLESTAGAVGAMGQDLRAARLWGAAMALRETIGIHWGTAERILHEPLLEAARSRLDKALWEAALSEGKAMRLEEAVEYALSEEETTPASSQVPERPLTAQQFTLTRREQEIATLVAHGLTNRQVALELSISEHTVATHLRRILKKLGLRSRSQVATWITEQGLLLRD